MFKLKYLILIILAISVLGGCHTTEISDQILVPAQNANWNITETENDKYSFFTSKDGIVRKNKFDNEEFVIVKSDSLNGGISSLCLQNNTLYYINNNSIYTTDLAGENKKNILSSDSLSECSSLSTVLEIWDINLIESKMYLLLTGFEVVRYDINEKQIEEIAYDVRSSCFINNSLYYTTRAASAIYKIDLKTLNEQVVVGSELGNDQDDYDSYQITFELKDKLYYLNNSRQLYRLNHDNSNEFITEVPNGYNDFGFIYDTDKIYYTYSNSKDERNIYIFDTITKKKSTYKMNDNYKYLNGSMES